MAQKSLTPQEIENIRERERAIFYGESKRGKFKRYLSDTGIAYAHLYATAPSELSGRAFLFDHAWEYVKSRSNGKPHPLLPEPLVQKSKVQYYDLVRELGEPLPRGRAFLKLAQRSSIPVVQETNELFRSFMDNSQGDGVDITFQALGLYALRDLLVVEGSVLQATKPIPEKLGAPPQNS